MPSEVIGDRVRSGVLVARTSRSTFPIVDYIPRFVSHDNYARNFGLQWTLHARTQYDSVSGHPVSRERFRRETKWPADLSGQIVLEAGCGSGRFTEQALATGATVVSFDYSAAVDANYTCNGSHDRLLLVQADIYAVPFAADFFDRVFCFGVLQHTPDPGKSFRALMSVLKPGGAIAADIYLKSLGRWVLSPKHWVRPFTRGKEPERLYPAVKRYVDLMWPLARRLRRIPGIGTTLNWKLLIADHSQRLASADEETLRQWAYLDSFDMLSPRYDLPQSVATFRKWFEQAGLTDIVVHTGYNGVEGRGRKPNRTSETDGGR